MKFNGLPIALDRTKPFVQAICKTFESNSNICDAISILQVEEQKHKISIWREPSNASQLSCGFFVAHNPSQNFSLSEIMQLLQVWDEFTKHYTADREFIDASRYDERKLIEQSLFPFLTDTNLILNGSHFTDDHFVLYENGSISAWTSRAWGALMAEWANETNWGVRLNRKGDKYKWDYVNFYIGLDNNTFENYYQWEDAVFETLKLKTEATLNNQRA